MAGNASRLIRYMREDGELYNRNFITTNNLESRINPIENNIRDINSSFRTTNTNVENINNEIKTTTNNFNKSQELLFSEKNILFEEGFKSIQQIQQCASIVIRIKQLIENNDHDYLFNKFYNYAKIIRPELDNLFAAKSDLLTKIFVQSSYPGEKTFNFNNLVYDKYTSYSLNNFDNSDISNISNIDKNIIGLLNTYSNRTLSNYLQSNPTATQFYTVNSFSKSEFKGIPQVAYFYFKLNQDKQLWTVIGVITDLPYYSIIHDDNTAYADFITAINSYINNWTPESENAFDDNITTVIEYKSALSFATTKCLYSETYPEWIGVVLPNLYKPNTQYDIVSEYTNTINSLWYNYSQLQENDIVVTSGFLGEEYYCNIIKIIKYPSVTGALAFIQQKINIKPFYPYVTIKNDVVVHGSFTVKNSEGENIIQTDNIKKVIGFNDKIGINQEIYNIKGLLDIDNLSNKSVDIIMSEFVQPLLNSYVITEQLKSVLTFDGLQDTTLSSSIYNQYNFAIFHTYILQSIEDGNIVFDHVEGDTSSIFNDFSQKQLTSESFTRIKQIVTELYTMIYLENLPVDDNIILSFIENLSDGNGSFICSLRALIRRNQTDNTYKIFFFTTYLKIDKYYNNFSYRKELDLLINNFSQAHRFLNYTKLILQQTNVKQNVIDGKTNDGTKETYVGFINNSNYFRDRFGNPTLYCFIQYFPYEDKLTPLHEKYPYWENKPGIPNILPSTDIPLQSIIESLYNNYTSNFGLFKDNYIFPVTYYFSTGIKISFLDTIELGDRKFLIGTGINLSDVISESIIAKGDNKITGNVSIVDEKTGNNIFNVDTRDKQSYLLYNVGIGTHNPETKLDVKDCGMMDAIEIINKLSSKFNGINFNIDRLKQYIITNGTANIKTFIETQFLNPIIDGKISDNKIIQTKADHFSFREFSYDVNDKTTNVDDVTHIYHYTYQKWNGLTMKEVLESEIQDKSSAKLMLNNLKFANDNNIFYNGSYRLNYYPWINGIKVNIGYTFSIGSRLFVLIAGIDIQNNLTYETNKNIVKFLETLSTHGNRIQNLVKQNINPTIVLNESVSKINRDKRILNHPNGRLFKYVIDMANKDNTRVQELNIDTYEPITSIRTFNSLNTSESDFQLRNKMTMLGIKLTEFYSAYWGTGSNYGYKPFFRGGQYGIIHFEDDYYDYCATVWLEKIDTTSIPGSNLLTFYSFELKLTEVLNASFRVQGDSRIEGDLYIHDPLTDKNFIFADANNHFLGINTTQVYGNYSNDYTTTTSSLLAKHNVYICSNTYPNVVMERTSEKQSFSPDYSADGETNYFYFKNFSASTVRRQSDLFNFQEMVNYSKLCRNNVNTGTPNAFGVNVSNVYCYGSDRNYEIKDKTGIIKEIGCIAMGIEKIEAITDVTGITDGTDAKSAFYVNVIDRVPQTMKVLERNIMYCSNDSNLYVNNVTTNGVRFGGHPDNQPNENGPKLWVDTQGRLRFGSGIDSDKVVNLSDP